MQFSLFFFLSHYHILGVQMFRFVYYNGQSDKDKYSSKVHWINMHFQHAHNTFWRGGQCKQQTM